MKQIKKIIVVVILAGAIMALATACFGVDESTESSYTKQPIKVMQTKTYSVVYKVSGTTSKASLTYVNATGGTEQQEVYLPWEKNFKVEAGEFLYVSAQNANDSGSVVCEIWIDGKKWKEARSSGAYVIASCDGLAGY